MMQPILETDQLHFEVTKEGRGWYFVEYRPPIPGYQFATLGVVVLEAARELEDIAAVMESELAIWLKRYPIPIMVSAFDNTGSLVHLDNHRVCSHLIGHIDTQTNKVAYEWRLLSNDELPTDALNPSYLHKVYSDIPYKTKQQLQEQSLEKEKQLRIGWWIVFVWAVVVPASVSVLEWWSDWLGFVVLMYSLFKAIEKALRLTGKWPKSKAEIQKEAENTRMRHHHYHCERNPKGFERLKLENFERWTREEIRAEAQLLKLTPRKNENDGQR